VFLATLSYEAGSFCLAGEELVQDDSGCPRHWHFGEARGTAGRGCPREDTKGLHCWPAKVVAQCAPIWGVGLANRHGGGISKP
jgi:hypothetical protein